MSAVAEASATPPPSVGRRALFLAITGLLVALAFEGVAQAFHYAAYGEFYSRDQLRSQNALDNITTTGVSHPYFGFTTPLSHHPLNNMPPLLSHDATLVVGLFGGSVALQLVHPFRARLAAFLGEEDIAVVPIVVELAQGGMKQPQQAHLLAYMLAAGGEFDLVVNLDGHNEWTVPNENASRGMFPPYPYMWDKRVTTDPADRVMLGRVALIKREQTQIQEIASGVLGSSAVVGLVLRRLFERHDERIRELHHEVKNAVRAYDLDTHGPRWGWYERTKGNLNAAVADLAVEMWYRSSLTMANLSATAGADYFHFLQPNQYLADSKPLSAEERTTAYLPGWTQIYARTYPTASQFGGRLRQAGVNFIDLTQTFSEVTETIYIDTCCHVNARGAQMLAQRMVDAIKPTVRRRAKSLADSRKTILTVARRPVIPDILVAEADYDIHLRDGKWLVYRRDACTPQDTEAPFFLHVWPSNPKMLPAERASYGFENLDFPFAHAGVFTADGACVAQKWLPSYEISRIRTGQTGALGVIWEAEFDGGPRGGDGGRHGA